MLKTVELDTLTLADRLSDVKRKLRICALACSAIDDGADNGAHIATMLREVEDEIEALSDEIHPTPPLLEKIDRIRDNTERRISKIIREDVA